jgi:2-oxoglutarate dehydrogenase E1 component
MKRNFRKPLVIMTPKSLLRHRLAVSSVTELANGTFQPVLDEAAAPAGSRGVDPDHISRLVLCSGKVYYELFAERERRQCTTVALIRVEQLAPLPVESLRDILARYAQVEDVVWVQEEPRNMGAWSFMHEHLPALLQPRQSLRYVGRKAQASPATGLQRSHQQEQAAILDQALTLSVEEHSLSLSGPKAS